MKMIPLVRLAFIMLVLAVAATSCKTTKLRTEEFPLKYRKVNKSKDLELKFRYAVHYLEMGDCVKALPLFEELIPAFRLSEKGELSYYNYARSYYCMSDYYMAGYYFKAFAKNNPSSRFAEDALFHSALCHIRTSPEKALDQTETLKAISELQVFMDLYPESVRKDTCNLMMTKLYKKLEDKKMDIARQYLKTDNYKSAFTAFETIISEYPASPYREEMMFLRVKSSYLLSQNSILEKQKERFEKTIALARLYAVTFPQSKHKRDTEYFLKRSEQELKLVNEQLAFNEVRNHYLLGLKEDRDDSKKTKHLEDSIKSYRTFASAYPESKYKRDAESIYANAEKALLKLKK